MRRNLAIVLLFVLWSGSISAKGITTRITIVGPGLDSPLQVTDPTLVANFNVWAGAGTYSSGVRQTRGFIAEWSAGPLLQKPDTGSRYEVSFFVRFPNRTEEQLAYIVEYQGDASHGYVFIPGPGDRRYALNVRSIHRGVEGNWFRATPEWQRFVAAQIAQAR